MKRLFGNQKFLGIIFVLIILINLFFSNAFQVFAQTAGQNLQATLGGLILRTSSNKTGESSSFYFLTQGGTQINPNTIIGQIKATLTQGNPNGVIKSSIDINPNNGNTLPMGLRLFNDGSLMLGGTSSRNTPLSFEPNERPETNVENPNALDAPHVYDFYLNMLSDHQDASPRLYLRSLFATEYQDAPDIALRRARVPQSEINKYNQLKAQGKEPRYGPLGSVEPGQNLGNISWYGYGDGDWYSQQALINGVAEDYPTRNNHPGSLHFSTTDRNKEAPEFRMSILPNGDVGINMGDVRGRKSLDAKLQVNGTIAATNKNFIIDHPTKPGKKLVHATLEGPENAVFYRGEGQLYQGVATITLPEYFEALTSKEGRSIQLSNIDGFDGIAVKTKNGLQIENGEFRVYSDNPKSSQRFNWEVKAVRSDIPELQIEK